VSVLAWGTGYGRVGRRASPPTKGNSCPHIGTNAVSGRYTVNSPKWRTIDADSLLMDGVAKIGIGIGKEEVVRRAHRRPGGAGAR